MSQADSSQLAEQTVGRLQAMIDQAFTEEQLDELRQRLQETEERMARLRRFPLENGDQPAPGFRPYRKGVKPS